MKQKINRFRALILFPLLLIAISGTAQEELSLMDAIRIGLDNNYQIKISEQQLEIAKNNNALGTTGIWPTVSLGINETNRFDNVPSQDPAVERNRFFTNSFVPYVNVRWTLFRGTGAIISKKQLALLEQFTEGNATVVVENTIQGIILAYYQVLLDQEKLEILDEVKQLSGDRFDYMEFKQELGGAVTYDVIQAKNSFLSDSTNYLLQELNLRNSNLVLKLLLGVPPDSEYVLTDEFKVETYDYELEALTDTMLSNNYTIRNQYINQEILKKDISLAKADIWPTLSVNTGFDQFNVRTQNVDESATFSNNLDFYANFSLNFNLYDGGRVKRAIQNARINEEIGRLETLDLERSLRNVMVNNYELYNIRKQLYEVAEVNLESNRLNLQISTDKYRSGAINSFNYRDVQLQFLNASFNQLEAVYNLIDTEVELLRLTGGLISAY